MRTRVAKYMTFLWMTCILAMATAAPQEQPEVKKKVEPWYPAVMKAAGVEGTVWVKTFIDEQGRVEKVEVIKATDSNFVETTVEAAKQWEFTPAMKDGKPIKAEVTIPFRFTLADGHSKSRYEDLLQLEEDVRKLLRGETVESIGSHIGLSAYAIVGNRFENLPAILSDKTKRDFLTGGGKFKVEMSRSIVGDAGDMAYLMVKTRAAAGKGERYHTVVFVKSPEGRWTISAWHAGP